MTYSHRIAANRNNAERYAHGTSPPNSTNSFFGNAGMSNRKTNQNRGAWQRSHTNSVSGASRCVGNVNNPILSPQPINTSSSISSPPVQTVNLMNRSGGRHSSGNKSNNHQRTNCVQALNGATTAMSSAAGLFGRVSPTTSSLPTIAHFAGSKCFDAPAPTALPKPPQHWTGGSMIVGDTGDGAGSVTAATAACRPAAGRRSQIPSQTSHHSAFKTARRTLFDDFGTHHLKLLLNVQS